MAVVNINNVKSEIGARPERPERRVRIYNIDTNFLLMAMNGMRLVKGQDHSAFKVPVFDGIPEGAVVERVGYEFGSDSLRVVVSHPSFDAVADYAIPPTHPDPLTATWQGVLVEHCFPEVPPPLTAAHYPEAALFLAKQEKRARSWEFLGSPR